MAPINHPTGGFLYSGIPFQFIPFLIPYLSHHPGIHFYGMTSWKATKRVMICPTTGKSYGHFCVAQSYTGGVTQVWVHVSTYQGSMLGTGFSSHSQLANTSWTPSSKSILAVWVRCITALQTPWSCVDTLERNLLEAVRSTRAKAPSRRRALGK